MRFIDLFAGIGGFRLGLEQAGHTCVYTNEWLKKPASIYEKNFGDKPDQRDIREITADSIPYADLIVGGFPCATFSLAGKRSGFSLEDTRGTLCFEMFRLARDKGIPYILFENVKGMLNHDKGKTFQVILSSLDEMGYDAQWELLDSQNFGIPQHRERIFLVASLRGKPRPKIFPITNPSEEDDGTNSRKQKTREGFFSNISPTLDAHYSKGGASRPYVVTQWRRGYFRDYKGGGTPTLTANMGTGGHNVPFIKNTNNMNSINLISQVKVRKHKVDKQKLKKLLKEHKTMSNKEISEKLNVPITKVEHWFREKSSFSIPDADIWFDLKKLLNIQTNIFDSPITEFEIKDNKFDMANRVYIDSGVSPTLTATSEGCKIMPFVKATITPDRLNKRQNGRRFKEDGEPSFTLGAMDRHGVAIGTSPEDMIIRKLTPIECERLQGLPDNFTKYYADGTEVSDSERYERCGRTVTSTVIKAIGDKLRIFEEENNGNL